MQLLHFRKYSHILGLLQIPIYFALFFICLKVNRELQNLIRDAETQDITDIDTLGMKGCKEEQFQSKRGLRKNHLHIALPNQNASFFSNKETL